MQDPTEPQRTTEIFQTEVATMEDYGGPQRTSQFEFAKRFDSFGGFWGSGKPQNTSNSEKTMTVEHRAGPCKTMEDYDGPQTTPQGHG